MNPIKYAQMIKYLTRVKKEKPDLADVFPASKAPIPAKSDFVETKDAINRFVRDNPRTEKAGGGRMGFKKGKDVRVSKNQYGEFETTYKKPTTLLDKYQTMLDDYAELVKDSLRLNDGTNLPKDFKQYVNNYTFADGSKAKYATYANLVARRSDTKYTKSLKPPVDVVNVKLAIMDNLITESNAGNKATNLTTLAKKVNWTDKDISSYKRQGKIKRLETPVDKVDKVYKNFFNNLDAPLEDFFNPIEKMSKETGLNRSVVSRLLNKNPNYTDEGKKLFKSLGVYALKAKYAEQGLTIGQFLDDYENRLFIGENGLLSMRNYNKPTSAIVIDAYRHWKQGGKQIEWINPPKLDKQGNLISLENAQFKYTGPNSSNTIWSASGSTVNGVKSKSIAVFGKDAPEFQKVFKDYEDIFRLENEIRPHPVTGKPTKMIDISKEAYNIGKGSSFGISTLARDHVNIIKDVFGNDPEYGTRILPRRINEYAGALKTIEQATKKGIGKNYTQNKIDKIYEKMGYNFTKSYDQILNDEYNLAKKVFNKFQAAGWGFDQSTNRWVIKEGFDVETAKNIDARGDPKNPNKILQSPFKMVEEREALDREKINTKKLIATLSEDPRCSRGFKSQGGRAGFQDGNPPSLEVCYQGGVKHINSGMKNATSAQAKNFAAFANRTASLGRGVLKYGIIPEAIYVAADSLIRVGMGDTFNEAILRATNYLTPFDGIKKAEMLEADRFFGPEVAGIIGKSIDYKNELAKVQSLEDQKANLENLSGGGEFDYIGDLSQDVKNIDAQIKQATDNLNNKFKMTDAEKIYADRMQEEVDDARSAGSFFTKLKSRFRDVEPDSDIETLGIPEKTQADLNKRLAPEFPRDLFLANKNELINYAKYQQSQGFNIPDNYYLQQQQYFKNMSLAELAAATSPEQVYGASGIMGEPINKPTVEKKQNVIGDMEKEIIGQTNVANPFEIDISDIGTGLRGFAAAGGGIAKEAGDSSGPPPASGPMSQGLQGLMKRVRNL